MKKPDVGLSPHLKSSFLKTKRVTPVQMSRLHREATWTCMLRDKLHRRDIRGSAGESRLVTVAYPVDNLPERDEECHARLRRGDIRLTA